MNNTDQAQAREPRQGRKTFFGPCQAGDDSPAIAGLKAGAIFFRACGASVYSVCRARSSLQSRRGGHILLETPRSLRVAGPPGALDIAAGAGW